MVVAVGGADHEAVVESASQRSDSPSPAADRGYYVNAD